MIGPRPAVSWDGATISTASLAELHLGVQRTADPDERARRLGRLGFIEAAFEPVPVDAMVARAWGGLAASCISRGLSPRRRTMDLFIAATAHVLGATLLTYDHDMRVVGDLIDVRVLGR